MAKDDHHGVGALVTNAARSRFFVQQKDASYPGYPLAYSTFGGAREPGEGSAQAAARELREELGDAAAALLDAGLVEVLTTRLEPDGFTFTLFEILVDDAQLDALAGVPVFEGERGALVTRAELAELPFIWGLGAVLEAYLRERSGAAPGVHTLALDVRFGDCDPAGIVYFPRFFDFFHQTMETWFPAHLGFGYDEFVRERKLGFPAVHSEADFERPSRFGERIEIRQRVTKLGRSSIEFAYEVHGPEGRRARGRSVCVVMNLDEGSDGHGQAVEIPKQLRARIEAFGVGGCWS